MTSSDEHPNGAPIEASDRGPDPVWGVGLFVVGLIVMAVGGAMTWHYVFNVGEAVLMIGSAVFLLFIAIASHKRDPIRWRAALRRVLGKDDHESEAPPDEAPPDESPRSS